MKIQRRFYDFEWVSWIICFWFGILNHSLKCAWTFGPNTNSTHGSSRVNDRWTDPTLLTRHCPAGMLPSSQLQLFRLWSIETRNVRSFLMACSSSVVGIGENWLKGVPKEWCIWFDEWPLGVCVRIITWQIRKCGVNARSSCSVPIKGMSSSTAGCTWGTKDVWAGIATTCSMGAYWKFLVLRPFRYAILSLHSIISSRHIATTHQTYILWLGRWFLKTSVHPVPSSNSGNLVEFRRETTDPNSSLPTMAVTFPHVEDGLATTAILYFIMGFQKRSIYLWHNSRYKLGCIIFFLVIKPYPPLVPCRTPATIAI